MTRLFFTPLAEADIRSILEYVARDRPETAIRVVAEIRAKCELLAQFPGLGERRPEISNVHRASPVRRWVIFYRVLEESVEVHRVLDGARDFSAIFEE